MRTMSAVVVGMVLAAGPVRAELGKGTFGVWGEMGFPSFTQVNKEFTDDVKAAKAGGATEAVAKEVDSLLGGGIAWGYEIDEITSIGLRAGYLTSNRGSEKIAGAGMDGTQSAIFTAIPIMGGGSLRTAVNEHLRVHASAYVGVAFTGAVYKSTQPTYEAKGKGSAFDGEVSVGADMNLTDATTLGVDVGYRLLNSGLRASGDVEAGGVTVIEDGDEFKDSNGDAAEYDYSGPFVRLSLNLHL